MLLKDLRIFSKIKSSFSFGESFHITIDKGLTIEKLTKYLTDKGHLELVIRPIQPTVEDCFMLLAKNN
jgi:hypothetical protein